MTSNDSDYTWKVSEVRQLDTKLSSLQSAIENESGLIRTEIHELKEDFKEFKKQRPLVIDNRGKTDWKGVAVIIGATIATILAALQQWLSKQ
jgi:50S ribosomal subunit-associated GTPase HflX